MDDIRFTQLLTRLVGVQRARLATPRGPARTLHRWILRHFGDTSAAPSPDVVQEWEVELGADLPDLLAQLVALDLIDADPDAARIRGAYPFAGGDRGHRVTVSGVLDVHAYCATGALGIPALLGRDVTIASTDPQTGQQIRVQVNGRRASWQPAKAAVSVPSLDSLNHEHHQQARTGAVFCPTASFSVDADAARAYATARRLDQEILTIPQALRGADIVFGSLLKR